MTRCASGRGYTPSWLWSAVGMLVVLYIVLCSLALAHGTPEFAQLTPDERNWMGEALTTVRSRPRLAAQGFVWHSCCNHGDRVIAKLRSIKDPSGKYEDVWQYLKKGDEVHTDEWVRIPNDVIHTEEDLAADSKMKNKMSQQMRAEGVLFVYNGVVTCFWAPEEGG